MISALEHYRITGQEVEEACKELDCKTWSEPFMVDELAEFTKLPGGYYIKEFYKLYRPDLYFKTSFIFLTPKKGNERTVYLIDSELALASMIITQGEAKETPETDHSKITRIY